jgi:tRNA pseudouridine55 synthase
MSTLPSPPLHHGFLVVDKPAGWTSHDVVARVRRLAGQRRVGHTGTLDPDATGVLIVCLGDATRLIEYTGGFHKTYRARLALGVETDTQDATGAVVRQADASGVEVSALKAALVPLTGEILQVPPMVSAVHHAGERLYEIARRGETVERAPRPVTIYHLAVSGFEAGATAYATLNVECSGGTYIRTLCHDMGAALGVGGHMAALRRTRIGPFSEEDATTLDGLESAAADGRLGVLVQPMDRLLPADWLRLDGAEPAATSILQGRSIPAAVPGEWAAFLADGRVLAVLRRSGDEWRPVKVFPQAARPAPSFHTDADHSLQ